MEVANHKWPCLCSITRECMPNKLEAHSARTWLEQDIASRILTQSKQIAYHQDPTPKYSLPLCRASLNRCDRLKNQHHLRLLQENKLYPYHKFNCQGSLALGCNCAISRNNQWPDYQIYTQYIPIYDQTHNTKVRMTESVKSKSQAVCMSGYLRLFSFTNFDTGS